MVEEKKKKKKEEKLTRKMSHKMLGSANSSQIIALIVNFNSLIKVTAMIILKMIPNITPSSKKYTLLAKAHTNFK